MNVLVKEENGMLVEEELVIRDPKTLCEYTEDFIGNAGGFDNGEWSVNADGERSTNREEFDWWDAVINTHQKNADRVHEICSELSEDERAEFEEDIEIDCSDLDIQGDKIAEVLDDWAEKMDLDI